MDAKRDPCVVWKRESFIDSASRYHKMVHFLSNSLRHAKIFASCIDSAEVDAFARSICRIFSVTGHILPFIRTLILEEFESKAGTKSKGTILRDNSIVCRLESHFVRTIGKKYLAILIKDLIEQVIKDEDLDLEIDPRRLQLRKLETEENESTLQENRKALRETAQLFLDRLTDRKMVDKMPREIRAIASYTAEYARKYAPETELPLVGGFIMLRYFSPAIVSPESYELLPPFVTELSINARRNLVLITKLLQGSSNRILFGGKEEYMICMNDFIRQNEEKMCSYLNAITVDPHAQTTESTLSNFGDLNLQSSLNSINSLYLSGLKSLASSNSWVPCKVQSQRKLLDNSWAENEHGEEKNSDQPRRTKQDQGKHKEKRHNDEVDENDVELEQKEAEGEAEAECEVEAISPGRKPNEQPLNHVTLRNSEKSDVPWSDFDTSDRASFNIKEFEICELFELHRLLNNYLYHLIDKVMVCNGESEIPGNLKGEAFVQRVMEKFYDWSIKHQNNAAINEDLVFVRFLKELGPPPFNYRRTVESESSMPRMRAGSMTSLRSVTRENQEKKDFSVLDKTRFVFTGGHAKSGLPVVYIIMNRLRQEILDTIPIERLITYIMHVIEPIVNSDKYELVIDMSWFIISKDLKAFFLQNLANIFNLFEEKFRKNVTTIYIVHPNAVTQAVLLLLRTLPKPYRLKVRIIELYNWQNLNNYIDPELILLPESSKNFITKAYSVIKVNAKGKSQKRIMKFTRISVLNIDPRTQAIKNERLLSEIEQISSFDQPPELHFKFSETSVNERPCSPPNTGRFSPPPTTPTPRPHENSNSNSSNNPSVTFHPKLPNETHTSGSNVEYKSPPRSGDARRKRSLASTRGQYSKTRELSPDPPGVSSVEARRTPFTSTGSWQMPSMPNSQHKTTKTHSHYGLILSVQYPSYFSMESFGLEPVSTSTTTSSSSFTGPSSPPNTSSHFMATASVSNISADAKKSSKFLAVRVNRTNPVDLVFRRCICNSKQERDEIIADIFESGFNFGMVRHPQEYRVIKVNQVGKHQERVFKLTCDSLLNVDPNSQIIKSEISFAGIENVFLDPNDTETLWLKYKLEETTRKIICKNVQELYQALQDAVNRYQKERLLSLRELEGSIRVATDD